MIHTDDFWNFNASIFSIVDYMLWTYSWWFTSDKSPLKWWMTDTVNLQYSASCFQFSNAIATTQCGQTMYLHINKLSRTTYKWRAYWVYFGRLDFQKKETGTERYCINLDSKERVYEVPKTMMTYRFSSILHSEFLGCDKIKQFAIFILFDAAECVHNSRLCLHFKIKRPASSIAR